MADGFGGFTTIRSSRYGDSFDVPNELMEDEGLIKTFMETQRDFRAKGLATERDPLESFKTIQTPQRRPPPPATFLGEEEEEPTTFREKALGAIGFGKGTLPEIVTDPESYKGYDITNIPQVAEDIWEPTKMLGKGILNLSVPTPEEGWTKWTTPGQKIATGLIETGTDIGKSLWGGEYGEAAKTAPELAGIPSRSILSSLYEPTVENVRESGTGTALAAGLFAAGGRAAKNLKTAKAARIADENARFIAENTMREPPPDYSGFLEEGGISDIGMPSREPTGIIGMEERARRSLAQQKWNERIQSRLDARDAEAARIAAEAEEFRQRQAWAGPGRSATTIPERFPTISRMAMEAPPPTNRTVFGALIPESLKEPYLPSATRTVWDAILPERVRGPGLGLTEPEFTAGVREAPISEPIIQAGMEGPELGPIRDVWSRGVEAPERRIIEPEEFVSEAGETPRPPERPNFPDEIESAFDELGDNPAAEIARERLEKAKPEGFVGRQKAKAKAIYKGVKHYVSESDTHAMRKFGEAGNSLIDVAERIDADAAEFAGKQIANLDRAAEGISAKERTALEAEAIDHVETGTNSANPKVQKIIDALRANDIAGNEFYGTAGMKVKNPVTGEVMPFEPREKYFPHRYPEGFVPKEDWLLEFAKENEMSVEQARRIITKGTREGYGFLDSLKSRLRNLPGYRKELDVARGHYIDMARKAHLDKNLGEIGNPESPVGQKLSQIEAEFGPEARVEAESIMSRYMGKDIYTGPEWKRTAANAATGIEAFTKLSTSSIRNLVGGVFSPYASGRAEVVPYMKAMKDVFTQSGRNVADEMGVLTSLWRDAAQDIGYGSKVGKRYGIEMIERFNRRFAGLAGRYEGETLFRRAKANPSEFNIRQLKQFILEEDMGSVLQQDKLTENQLSRAANRMVDMTQGRATPLQLPHAWSSPEPIANVLTQFKKYAFIQSKNYKDGFFRGYEPTAADMKNPRAMAALAKNWNYMMIPKLVVAGSIIGEVPAEILAWIKGKERPDPGTLARYIQNLSSAYGFGMAQDMIQAFSESSRRGALEAMAPPAISDIEKLGEVTFGDRPLLPEIAGAVPVIGSRLRQAVKPSKKKKKAGGEIQYY